MIFGTAIPSFKYKVVPVLKHYTAQI